MIKNIILSFALLSLGFSVSAHALGGIGGDCKKVAMTALIEAGVTGAVYIAKDNWGIANPDNWFWFAVPSCGDSGYVNVVTDANCYVKQIVTRYGCKIAGIPHSSW